MAEELKTTLIALFAGGFVNATVFLVRYILTKRARNAKIEETESETRNTDSETRNTDADTIETLMERIDKLFKISSEQRDDIVNLQAIQAELIIQNKILVKQNKELVKKNDSLEISVDALTQKNETLSDLVISEQIEKSRFRQGVVKLIEQMKEAGITEPAFKP